ncbi:MAG: excisionase family DNA-binding protein [Desulfobacteria bacterium]
MDEKSYFTVAEAAKVLRLHPKTLRRAIREGRIPGVRRVPGCRRFLIPRDFVEGHVHRGDAAA